MKIGDLGGIGRATGVSTRLGDVKRLIGLPGMPAIATAATIAAKLRGLAELDAAGGAMPGERLSMLSLGLFLFGVDTIAYQEFQRRTDYRHAATERLGAMPAFQYLGPGVDSVSLPGVLMPELTGPNTSIQQLREMAATGDAFPMLESNGTVIGKFILRSVEERKSNFLPGGGARRIEFALELERVAD